jgi:hypothetical protein
MMMDAGAHTERDTMTRRLPEFEVPPVAPGAQIHQGGANSGGQSGDTQGLSQAADATEETVEELADDGQDYEAGIQAGVEDAADHPERPVPSHDGQERHDSNRWPA